MKTMKMLAVATGLLAVPFGAFAETAVTDAQAARDAVWEQTVSYTAPGLASDSAAVISYHGSANLNADAATAHFVAPGSAWADNYLAGRVFGPAGN